MFHDLIQTCMQMYKQADVLNTVQEYKDNDEVKEIFRLMLDKSLLYYMKKVPDVDYVLKKRIRTDKDLIQNVHNLLTLDLRGDRLRDEVVRIAGTSTPELKEVFSWILDRKNPARISTSTVNKVWPGLLYVQPYIGAVPGTEKALSKLPWSTGVNVQVKEDGMTMLVHYEKDKPPCIRTRQGQDITKYFPVFLSRCPKRSVYDCIVHYEGLVWDSEAEEYLPRQVGNGLISKAIKNGVIGGSVDYSIHPVVLDVWYKDLPDTIQRMRYLTLNYFCHPYGRVVKQFLMYDIKDARKWAKELIQAGGEGVICKDPNKPFKQGKPSFNVKIKNEFTVELIVTGYKKHTKYPDQIGSLICESSDGYLEVNVGSGLTDKDRIQDPEYYIGEIVSVTAESIIKSKGKKKPSLYLPRFSTDSEGNFLRTDKSVADTYREIKEQEEASKGVVL